MTSTALTFFSGAGGMCNGLDQAGFEIIGGNEWDDQIADIWDSNHDVKCDRRSILDIPTASLPYADLYHFSPPCQLHSQSNPNRTTGTDCEDTAIAEKLADIIINGPLPRWVTVENVPLYQRSKSWQIIACALSVAGYSVVPSIVNAYEFACPQRRRRFIVRASLKSLKALVPSTKKVGWDSVLLPTIETLRQTILSRGQSREFLKKSGIPITLNSNSKFQSISCC